MPEGKSFGNSKDSRCRRRRAVAFIRLPHDCHYPPRTAAPRLDAAHIWSFGGRPIHGHTSRFLEPFLRWLNPDISAAAIDTVRWLVRKAAHMSEYAVLAWLWWRALRRPVRNDARPWSWKTAGAAWALTVLYAASDEFHQTFVANRTGSILDVGIDAAGGALGLGLLRLGQGWRQSRRRPG